MKCPACGSTKTHVIGDKLVCWKCGEILKRADAAPPSPLQGEGRGEGRVRVK